MMRPLVANVIAFALSNREPPGIRPDIRVPNPMADDPAIDR
jgi:hypothetical protein